MTISPISTSLIRPPPKPIATPDVDPILGSVAPIGAGSTVPLPAPQGDGISPVLPFGNGVAPVLMAPPAGGPVMDPQISPVGVPGAPAGGSLENTMIGPGSSAPMDPGPVIQGAAPSGAPILGSPAGGTPILGSQDFGPEISPVSDPRTDNYRGMLDRSAAGLETTDRRSMLGSLLSDFDTQTAERDSDAMTQVGRRDAALGRLGSGMTSGALGTIARQSARDRQQFRNSLAASTIDKEIGDRFQKTGLFSGLARDAYGEARSERDERRGERGYRDARGDRYRDEARGERGYADDRGDRYRSEARGERGYFDDRGDRYRDEARGERSWQYGVGRDNLSDARSNRDELRGERGYQDAREAYSTDRGIQERDLSERYTDTAFNRALARLNAGRAGNPAGAYVGAASDLEGQGNATLQALMQYLQSLGVG